MSGSSNQDEAIQLITVKDDGILGITIEAINLLSSFQNKKIAVLSVTGPSQSGKSSLFNTFLHNDKAFQSHTKGLFIWNKPIELENDMILLLIDSQGLSNYKDAVEQKLFMLNILLSSCLMYNTCGAINEDKVSEIETYCDVANKIHVNTTTDNNHKGTLSKYIPEMIWVLRDIDINDTNKPANDLLEEQLTLSSKGDKIKQLFTNRTCVYLPTAFDTDGKQNNMFIEQADLLYEHIKKTIPYKQINQIELDGNALFGILQNYLDLLNNDENPVISLALENVLLSKANSISDKHFDMYKSTLTSAFAAKYPMNTNDIYKTYFQLQAKETEAFCSSIQNTLTPLQCGTYLSKLHFKMQNELESVFETNKQYYDEWFGIEYKELQKNISALTLDSVSNIKSFFGEYVSHIQTSMNKLLEIPNYDCSLNIIDIAHKITSELIVNKLQKYTDIVSDMCVSTIKEQETKIEEMNTSIKELNDHISSDMKVIETINNEKRELNKKLLEIETKLDKLNSEIKLKEKENANMLLMENKKSKQLEEYYQLQIKEKDNVIAQNQMLIDKLNKELSDIKKDNIVKANELHQENVKLHSELEKIKENKTEQHSTSASSKQHVTLQTMFKSIQHTFNQFEESLSKFDKETQNILKMKHIEQSSIDIKNKIRNWIEEVKAFNESQLKALSDTNEKKLKELNEKLDEMKWNIDKKDYTIKEQCNLTDTYKRKLEVVNKELEDTKEIANSKNELIDKQKETITMLEERVSGLEKENADLEVNLNKNVFNYKMKEDEIETLVMVFGGILSKRKDKYEHNMQRLSIEPKRAIEELVKQYKLFK